MRKDADGFGAAVHTSTHSRIFCDQGRTHAQALTSSALWGCRLPNIAASNEFKFCPPHFPNSAGSPSGPVGARQHPSLPSFSTHNVVNRTQRRPHAPLFINSFLQLVQDWTSWNFPIASQYWIEFCTAQKPPLSYMSNP